MITAGYSKQGIAAVHDMDGSWRGCSHNRPGRWGRLRGRRNDRVGMRNDQLLAGRKATRPLVSVGLQDCSRRHIVPAREDFQSAQGRALYDLIVKAPDRDSAERAIAKLELDEVDIDSFLGLSGEHYYTYPALVRERAAAIRAGKLTVAGT